MGNEMLDSNSTTQILRRAIIANHVEFLRTHRGRIEHEGALTRCVSASPAFCFAIVTAREAFAQDAAKEGTLYIPSWLVIPEALTARLTPSHSFTYMLRDTGAGAANPRAVRAQTSAEMEDFAVVQARGFCEDDAADIAAWKPFMGAADHANLTNPLQDFFVDYDTAAPVACSLSVYAASIAGIYAVATVPPARKQGRAGTLLNHAASAAAARGFSILGLQTETGSDAERLYIKQGFRPLFHMRVFKTA
jgi:GNAT superfamily N-acetyltransferase